MNQISTGLESELKLNKILFSEINFRRSETDINCNKLQIEIGKHIEYVDENNAKVNLNIKIFAADNSLDLSLTMLGFFEFTGLQNKEFMKDIVETNTIAIMFPYLRSQVSLITTQPDMSPIVIPALNINKLIDSDK
ncbi:protein-export chaperone SecB [Clostridium minihomine]|uniref:protein-export chaperone SecB n=1 Tax=Clostridium minihomine TaxID=2045012 RepID=UPI000C7851F2|nr:protein-export chaperone SecB [Clostridium minihomine]